MMAFHSDPLWAGRVILALAAIGGWVVISFLAGGVYALVRGALERRRNRNAKRYVYRSVLREI